MPYDSADEALVRSVIGAFYDVYNELGFGFLEYLYVKALQRELVARGHLVEREVRTTVLYKGVELGNHRLDMIVDKRLVVETKATQDLPKVATRQVFNYLKATKLELGLLLHFSPQPRFYRFQTRH